MAAEAVETTSSDFAKLAASFQTLAEALAAREVAVAEPTGIELVTVGETSDPKLDRRVFCRDCLDVRYPAEKTEPPTGGSAWGSHYTSTGGARQKVEHPRKPKILTYDKRIVVAGLAAGTHGKQCLQCGSVLLQEVL